MTIATILRQIETELDSIQCKVRLVATDYGVIIHATLYVDRVLAKRELTRRGILIAE